MIPVLRRLVYLGSYAYALAALGACGAFAIVANVLRWSPAWVEPATTRFIARLSRTLTRFMQWGGAAVYDFRGFDGLPARRGVIFAANHPTYADALLLFGALDRVLCVMKPSLRRNPLLAQIARAAGYLDPESPRQLVKSCVDRLAAGGNLLVFPEGTRSPERALHPFKPGFAHVAVRAGAPVIPIYIDAPAGDFLRKGSALFRPWQPLPLRYRFRSGGEFRPDPGESTRAFLARVEASFHSRAEVAA